MRQVGPLAIGLLLLSRPAVAADRQIRPYVGLTFGGATTYGDLDLDNTIGNKHPAIGLQTAWLGNIVGVEVDIARMPGFFQAGTRGLNETPRLLLNSSVTTLTGSVVVAAPFKLTQYTLRPYFVAGGGLMRVRTDTQFGVLNVRDTIVAMNLGGGAIGFVTSRVGVAWDVRRLSGYNTAPPAAATGGNRRLTFWRASMALVIRY